MNRTHVVRIIGGRHKGQNIPISNISGLRPTPARIRETLFNWLMHDIHNLTCLDAFAGSGALGFEAFSRGAAKIVLLESHNTAYKNLEKQATHFHSSKILIHQQNALEFMKQTACLFDLIFLDPPFNTDLLDQAIKAIEENNILKQNGLLYVESSSAIALNPKIWQPLKEKKAGLVFYSLYRRNE